MMWERSERYYIPSYHGNWDNFTKTVAHDHAMSGRQSIFGKVNFEDKKPLRREERGESALPDNCRDDSEPAGCGVGKGADLSHLIPSSTSPTLGGCFPMTL